MKTLMPAIALTLVIAATSYAQAIDGDWHGTLDEGKIDAGATSIEGTWSQSGNNLPLAWKRPSGR